MGERWQMRVRSAGYVDGLSGLDDGSLGYHPTDRFTYRAGYRDGQAALEAQRLAG